MNRRHFSGLLLASGAAATAPHAVRAASDGAIEISESEVDIRTSDGTADAFLAHPVAGRHPAVLMWPDNRGLSPTFRILGRRLAQSGYAVLIPNPYYRFKRAPVVPVGASGGAPEVRAVIVPLMEAMSYASAVTDITAFVGFLDHQRIVDRSRGMATCAYSNMARQAIRTAAHASARVKAVSIFHGDGLLTDQPDSPHRLLPKIRARFAIAITESDDQREPAATLALREAFAKAHVAANIEVYPGTTNGWCLQDSRYYNEAQANRAWNRMLALFSQSLS